MNKSILSTLIAISAMTSTGLCADPSTKEETAASLIIGRILTAIDYNETHFTLNSFVGSFVKKDKDSKPAFVIEDLDVNSLIKFKTDVIIDSNEFSKEPNQSEKSKQWQQRISLLSKDLKIKSSINSKEKYQLILNIEFNKLSNSTNNQGLTIQVGNQFNKELIWINFTSLYFELNFDPQSSEVKVLGSCIAREKIGKIIQPVSTCTIAGAFDTEKETHDIRVNFGIIKDVKKKLN